MGAWFRLAFACADPGGITGGGLDPRLSLPNDVLGAITVHILPRFSGI